MNFTVLYHNAKVWDVYAVLEGDVILQSRENATQGLRVPVTELSEGAYGHLIASGWLKGGR